MAKEKFLTIYVPIKDSDCEADVYADVSQLPTASASNINKIYKVVADNVTTYYRSWFNPSSGQMGAYEYADVVDREFPYLGNPMCIYDFTYSATRMGTAPNISAQGVMRFAEPDGSTLDDLWVDRWQDCFVIFNGSKLYLKQIPTSGKANEDARYKYDMDFVDESVVLEGVYFYDIVSPFITEKPISEQATFPFFGDAQALADRINASLIRSGLAQLTPTHVHYPSQEDPALADVEMPILTYAQWNQVGVDPWELMGVVFNSTSELVTFCDYIYEPNNADYNAFLRLVYTTDGNGEFVVSGYQVKLGTDKKGEDVVSEEKLITFDKNTIYEALQEFHDTFELQYYIAKDKDANGEFTGNTTIWVADCEHDFADRDDGVIVRDADGIPVSTDPFDYGTNFESGNAAALLSKEKTNTTDKIVTRITGVGSTDNIPWYYPNPTADGWLKPVLKKSGVEQSGVVIDYPTNEGSTTADMVRFEKYLKNRIGSPFIYGRINQTIRQDDYGSRIPELVVQGSRQFVRAYYYIFNENLNSAKFNVKLSCPTGTGYPKFIAALGSADELVYNSSVTYQNPSDFQNVFMRRDDGGAFMALTSPTYILRMEFDVVHMGNSMLYDYIGYYYPDVVVQKTLSGGANDLYSLYDSGVITPSLTIQGHTGENFYDAPDLQTYLYYTDESVVIAGVTYHFIKVIEAGRCVVADDYNSKMSPIARQADKQYKDVSDGVIYKCTTSTPCSLNGTNASAYEAGPLMIAKEWLDTYVRMELNVYQADSWYLKSKSVNLGDYGIDSITIGGSTYTPDILDTIDFARVKYLTPQSNLMPEVYIKTDGERRCYNAHDYYPLQSGTASSIDTAIGEELNGSNKVVNPIYKENETDPDDKHYDFENEYVSALPHEHIEDFDDIKPTIKGQKNYIPVHPTQAQWNASPTSYYYWNSVLKQYVQCTAQEGYDAGEDYFAYLRIDVVAEFGYDLYDNDEIWENNDNGSVEGEYKHPYLFAKLLPLGFNLFDLALQDDMVLSMTTGDCGACEFKIGVDDRKKNPVQLWAYDVYDGSDISDPTKKLYSAGDLMRYIDTTGLYYNINGTPTPITQDSDIIDGGFISGSTNLYKKYEYSGESVENGQVGTMKKDGSVHFEGDVITSGRYIASQQDTSENFVWVALFKDTDTYGILMPSATPNYSDPNFNVYIRPKSIADVHTSTSTPEEDEENADKFVLFNIKLPQVYLRNAERELSRKLVNYMYKNNYQKFNFSIKFSRIFIKDNTAVNDALNENSVLYVGFNNAVYRQYVKNYTYRMSHEEPYPEISVDMNEELSVSRTLSQTTVKTAKKSNSALTIRLNTLAKRIQTDISKRTMEKDATIMMSGNIVIAGEKTSVRELIGGSGGNGGGGTTLQWGYF